MLIQLIIVIFTLFVASRMVKKIRKQEITLREFILWMAFWLVVAIAALLPKTADIVANFFGVERGSNLAVYISIITIFYLLFNIMVKLQEIEKNMTKIVRNAAIKETMDNRRQITENKV